MLATPYTYEYLFLFNIDSLRVAQMGLKLGYPACSAILTARNAGLCTKPSSQMNILGIVVGGRQSVNQRRVKSGIYYQVSQRSPKKIK